MMILEMVAALPWLTSEWGWFFYTPPITCIFSQFQ
jgi:hypothetical protein